jgi:modulator of FtsH protease HflK
LTLFFLNKRSYKEIMDKEFDAKRGKTLNNDAKGPWDNTGGTPRNGNGKGPKQDLPTGAENNNGEKGPRNPWDPVSIDGGKSASAKGRGPSLEELLRRAGGGGGNGWGGMPRRAGGGPLWPLLLVGVASLWLLWSSVHQLDPGEEGVITRFGKYSRTVGSGISLTLPAPFEQMQKIDTQQARFTNVGKQSASDDNLVLTKDQNLVDLSYQISWDVRDPEKFLFQLDEAIDGNRDATVTAVAESAMRATLANFNYDVAVGEGRLEIENDVRKRMQDVLNGYGSGIHIRSIAIKESDPPEQTREAFNRVTVAQQQRESNLSGARAFASRVTQRAQGDTAEFDSIYTQYTAAPEVTKRRLYYQTMEQVLAKADKTIVESGNVTPYLPLPEIRRRAAAKPAAAAEPDVTVVGEKK